MVKWLFAAQTVLNMMFAPFSDIIIYVGGAFACLISLMVKPMGLSMFICLVISTTIS
jgi:hypothetical protein